jgi:hypothetical protein
MCEDTSMVACGSVCVHLCAYAWMCTRAFVSAHVHGFVHFHRIASSRACVFGVCVCMCIERVCAPRRCVGPLVARPGLAVFIARPATPGGHACVSAFV